MSASESLVAQTLHAAYAIDMGDQIGALEVGRRMDVALLELDSYKQIGYKAGQNFVHDLIVDGVPVFSPGEQ
jgi:imidazolonepropionase